MSFGTVAREVETLARRMAHWHLNYAGTQAHWHFGTPARMARDFANSLILIEHVQQNMFGIWSSILMQVNESKAVGQ